jgi:hypothetical protein
MSHFSPRRRRRKYSSMSPGRGRTLLIVRFDCRMGTTAPKSRSSSRMARVGGRSLNTPAASSSTICRTGSHWDCHASVVSCRGSTPGPAALTKKYVSKRLGCPSGVTQLAQGISELWTKVIPHSSATSRTAAASSRPALCRACGSRVRTARGLRGVRSSRWISLPPPPATAPWRNAAGGVWVFPRAGGSS